MKELSEQKLEKVAEIVDGERVSMSIKSITPNKGRNKKLESIDKHLIKNALEAKVIRPNEVSPIKDEQLVAQRNVEKVLGVKVMSMLSDEELDFLKSLDDLEEETRSVVIKEMFSEKVAKEWSIPTDSNSLVATDKAKKFVRLYTDNYNRLINGESYKSDEQIKLDAGYSEGTSLSVVMRNPYVAKKLNAHREGMAVLRDWHLHKMSLKEQNIQDDVYNMQSLMIKHAYNNPDTVLKSNLRNQAAWLTALNGITQNKKDKNVVNNIGSLNISPDMAGIAQNQFREKEEFLNNSFK